MASTARIRLGAHRLPQAKAIDVRASVQLRCFPVNAPLVREATVMRRLIEPAKHPIRLTQVVKGRRPQSSSDRRQA